MRTRSNLTPVRLSLVIALAGLVALAVSYRFDDTSISHAQGPDGKVTHTMSGNADVWRIDQPNVKQPMTEYKQIQFKPGDKITISGGGCVQTGGVGRTWKLYVNPSGSNTDRFYHGMVWIPGVIGGPAATGVPPGLRRIKDFGNGNSVIVPANADPRQLYLRLGYDDDNYGDNGYYSHDDGDNDQCRNVANAFVQITIQHGFAAPTSAAAPFDLVWDSEDDNGIPFNAKWGSQLSYPGHPGAFPDPLKQCAGGPFKAPCTSSFWQQIIGFDTGTICSWHGNENFGVAGHANWAAGTYEGGITWESKSPVCGGWDSIATQSCDDDYNFDFVPEQGAALTSVRPNIEVEFDSDETIDNFHTPWWNQFHSAVDNKSNDEINRTFFNGSAGRYAIVNGLIGLDCGHDCHTELHPVWAIAMRVKDNDPADEVWAMFVRRTGDEGFCSNDQHDLLGLPNDAYTFRLPWRPGATSVSVSTSTTFQSNFDGGNYSVAWSPNQGVTITFSRLPSTDDMLDGELHLKWTGGQPAPIPAAASVRRFPVRATQEEEPEEQLSSLLTRMTPTQRGQFMSPASTRALVSTRARTVTQAMRSGSVSRLQSLPRHAARPPSVQYKSVPDANKRARDQRNLDGLRRVFGIRVPK